MNAGHSTWQSIVSGASALALLWCLFLGSASAQERGVPENAGPEKGDRRVRALVTAQDRAVLSAELTGRITAMNPRPSETFEKGDTLVRFACDRFVAQRNRAKAEAVIAAKTLESIDKLVELKSAGRLKAEIGEAELDGAQAQLRLYQADVDRCTIRAPFAGRVVAWYANPHEIAVAGVKIMEIVSDGNLAAEMIVSSSWLSWLKPGLPLTFFVDETRASYRAEVSAIGAVVDPVSQTISVRAHFTSAPGELISGMSGMAVLDKPSRD